ncbi:MAG: anti-sigma factor [Desulfomonilaceae bacterium]
MKCEDFQKRISKLIDKELSTDSLDALHRHLLSCADCSEFYERSKDINQVLSSATFVLPNTALAQRVKEKITNKTKGSTIESRPTFWRSVPVYAMVALLAVGVGNLAGKTLVQNLLDQNSESALELMIPNGTEYLSDIFVDIGQEGQAQ